MFGNRKLKAWLSEDYSTFKNSLKNDIKAHLSTLKLKHHDLYGYALLPGTSYEINSLVVASNRMENLKEDNTYYKYCVDEWATWEHDVLPKGNAELKNINNEFSNIHNSKSESCNLDKYETKHITNILNTCLVVLQELFNEGEFLLNDKPLFVIIWLSGDEHPIVINSLSKLNSKNIVDNYLNEFR